MTLWLLMLAIPAQSWAAVVMTHCKDMQGETVNQGQLAHHDHAAMTRQMAEASVADSHERHHAHHAMSEQGSSTAQNASAGSDVDTKPLDCECGCDCSGNCAVSCAASVVSLGAKGVHPVFGVVTLRPASLRSQALAAHCLTPLRPPSAAAI